MISSRALTAALGVAIGGWFAALVPAGWAGELPTPCSAGTCGLNGPSAWVTSGAAGATLTGSSLTVQQSSASATLNWQSFNISSDGSVVFQQPDASSVALNRIFQADPSRIFGALRANGTIFLINQNGILFGKGAKVDVGGLVASSLDITPQAVQNGIAGAGVNNAAAFTSFIDASGVVLPSGSVRVDAGATVTAHEGGQVLMFAPEVVNEGEISTPHGQTILAAGQSIYLANSTDPNLRGLLVEVGVGGAVTNGSTSTLADEVGRITAEQGNVTLGGLAVNQLGRITATTSVRQNGSVRLQARDGGSATFQNGVVVLKATNGGDLRLGSGSVTEAVLSGDADTTVDANVQPASRISLEGRRVELLDNSRVTARAGQIDIIARSDPTAAVDQFKAANPDDSRVYVAPTARLDAAGASVDLPVSRNVVRAELRGNELADSPLQRDGPLRSQPVFVDVRASGTRADGSTWQGTPLADVSGEIASVARGVAERSLNGGSVDIASHGSVIVAPGAQIDVSGGRINYLAGYVNTTQLLGVDGKVYDIANADRDRQYVGILDGTTVTHQRWGVTETFVGFPGVAAQGIFEPGYVEGKDAGTVAINAPAAILDGDVVGNVAIGRYQRAPTSATIGAGQLYRSYNQIPAGAQLIVGAAQNAAEAGSDLLVGNITFHPGSVLPTLKNDDGSAFDALTDPIPLTLLSLNLRPELLGPNRVARASLFANDTVKLESDQTLTLPAGGSFQALGGRVEIAGAIDVQSGSIGLTSQDTISTSLAETGLDVSAGAKLRAVGQWINDDPAFPTNATLPGLWIDGGTISLAAKKGNLSVAAGTLLDVSAGAWERVNGSIAAGRGGTIRLSATPESLDAPVSLQLGAELRGYAVSQGGSLQLTVGGACIASFDCSVGAVATTWLSPELFSNGGFASYTLTTNTGALRVLPDTVVRLQQSNLEFIGATRHVPTGTDIATFTRTVVLPEYLRAPTNLSLATELAASVNPVTNASFAGLAGLTLGSRSLIDADPLAKISLRANSSLVLDGTIQAPGGSIDVELDETLGVGEFLRSQGLWLDAHGVLDVNGREQLTPNSLGLREGSVLPGGTVTVLAKRGFLVTHPDSLITADGAAAELDLRADTVVGATRTVVPSAGGTVSITTAEGAVLSGRLSAASGGGQAAGGTLSIRVDPNNRGTDPGGGFASLFSTAPRTIVVTAATAPLVIAPGTEFTDDFVGRAVVGADRVVQGGFAALDLSASTLDARANTALVRVPGRMSFAGDVTLNLARRLTLDAAVLSGSGAVQVTAPYVAIGHTDQVRQLQVEPTAELGGSFVARGTLIDVIGDSSITGFASVKLASDGDLRARGVQGVGERSIEGALWTNASDLTLEAAQVYATTLSDFGYAIRNNPTGTLTVLGNGESRADVLSAGSKLVLTAPTIYDSGVLRAPLGEIDLQATDLTLAPNSIVSTSASNLVIPFGSTQGGLDWVYELFNDQTLVFGAASGSVSPPRQRISLAASNVNVLPGAVLDASGGGDLLSYEFVPGPGGTRDVLSAQVSPNEFAIVPALNVRFAPYDQRELEGSPLQVGDNVHLAGGGGLPAGDYVLLPARYSLLDGAFLVRPVAGYQDILPGEVFPLLGGGTVVSGYRTIAGTSFADSRTSGFAVAPASLARQQATYTTTSGNDFFSHASADGTPSPFRAPRDAGSVVLQADATLSFNGSLLAASAGGRGAAVDIAGSRLLVASAGTPVAPGEVLLDVASLNDLGAESLFIGGQRVSASTGTLLDVGALDVTVGAGSSLHAPELIIGGRDSVTVQSGATLAGSGSAAGSANTYAISGDAAILRVSSGGDAVLLRTATTGASGRLTLEPGSTLSANGGSIALDAAAGVSSDAELEALGGALRFGADRIVITDGGVSGAGLLLRPGALADLHLDQLVLSSRSTVDVGSNLDLNLNALSIEAGGINALAPDLAATISVAGTMKLANPLGLALPGSAVSGSRLQLHGRDIVASDGTFGLTGFATVALQADDHLSGNGSSGIAASGALDIVTGRVTADVGADLTVTAGDLLRLLPSTSAPLAAAVGDSGVGAHITLQGARVEGNSLIEAHGGTVRLRSLGNGTLSGVYVGPNGLIDVTGLEKSYDGVQRTIPGGQVELSAALGDVLLDTGSRIDVSGAVGGDAGRVSLLAPVGRIGALGAIAGTADAGAQGGSLYVDAAQVDDLGSLAQLSATGGLTNSFYLRQRGAGDLRLGSGSTVRDHEVTLIADGGGIAVDGIDARGSSGGSIRLVARDGIAVSGRLDASATDAEGRGGEVDLFSSTAGVTLAPTSVIDVSAGAGTTGVTPTAGKVNLRIPQSVLQQVLSDPAQTLVSLAGEVVGSARTALEGFLSYDRTGPLLAADVAPSPTNPLFSDATAFMASAPALAAALGRADDPTFHIVPGIEIRSTGDLSLTADWNLFPWRFNGEPGVLTLRAGGDLLFNRSLSDGFQAITGLTAFVLPATPTSSWSYRLVAGADPASADPLAVLSLDALGATGGSVRVASGVVSANPSVASTFRMIRTGTGSIDIAAARDFSLGNQASVVYTAGVSSAGTSLAALGSRTYPVDGGDVSIDVGGDITGAASNELVTDWLWRVGRPAATNDAGSARAWTVNFQRFEQNVGALAGGNVTVRAGGTINNLSISIPSIGRQVGGTLPAVDSLQIVDGGDLTVEAGGTIRGGSFYVGRGTGRLTAGAELSTNNSTAGGVSLYPLLLLGDARFDVTAGGNLGIDGAIDPFLLPQGRSQAVGQLTESFYSLYSDRSAVSLLSIAGDITLRNDTGTLVRQFGGPTGSFRNLDSRQVGLSVYPPSLAATSFSGDIQLNARVSLFPSPYGDVNLFADDNVEALSGSQVLLSDTDPLVLPVLAAPKSTVAYGVFTEVLASVLGSSPLLHATVPVHDAGRRNGLPEPPARVVARTGDISMPVSGPGDSTLLYFAKPVRLVAGQDLLDVGLIAQNIGPNDVTSLIAGRDVRYSIDRGSNGSVVSSLRELTIDGPGQLQIQAGRDIDLQTSAGISTRGNLASPYLSPEGAGISLLAGVGDQLPDYTGFAARYFTPASDYGTELVKFVERVTGQTDLGFDAALAEFSALDLALRRQFTEQVFFDELRLGGREAAISPNQDFTRAFTALATLFPGSNPAPDSLEQNPYKGDIRLYFSRGYTLDGGDIFLFAPGGVINVGLAAPPASFGISKSPAQLGLVAQSTGSIEALAFSDFQVNESRVFAADGGNILVWSTEGDIDAGRGAKTAISAPPPTINIDANGRIQLSFPAALAGSGIQTLATTEGRKPGNVDLFAPRGVVNAGDAGIVAGNLTIAATAVLGADNISVSGVSVGVPVDTGGFAAALSGVSAVAASAANTAEQTVTPSRQQTESETPLSAQALGFLDVFITGFGEDCDPRKQDCGKGK